MNIIARAFSSFPTFAVLFFKNPWIHRKRTTKFGGKNNLPAAPVGYPASQIPSVVWPSPSMASGALKRSPQHLGTESTWGDVISIWTMVNGLHISKHVDIWIFTNKVLEIRYDFVHISTFIHVTHDNVARYPPLSSQFFGLRHRLGGHQGVCSLWMVNYLPLTATGMCFFTNQKTTCVSSWVQFFSASDPPTNNPQKLAPRLGHGRLVVSTARSGTAAAGRKRPSWRAAAGRSPRRWPFRPRSAGWWSATAPRPRVELLQRGGWWVNGVPQRWCDPWTAKKKFMGHKKTDETK